jgi:hypothetical protein
MKRYAINATVVTERDGWTSTRQVPTFFLDGNVQGIATAERAEEIARDLLLTAAPDDNRPTVYVHAQEV